MKEPISPYVEDRYAEKNEFISMQPDMSELPDFEKEKGKLPEPVWAGHDDEIAAYYKLGDSLPQPRKADERERLCLALYRRRF